MKMNFSLLILATYLLTPKIVFAATSNCMGKLLTDVVEDGYVKTVDENAISPDSKDTNFKIDLVQNTVQKNAYKGSGEMLFKGGQFRVQFTIELFEKSSILIPQADLVFVTSVLQEKVNGRYQVIGVNKFESDSYLQHPIYMKWREDGVLSDAIFEVLSVKAWDTFSQSEGSTEYEVLKALNIQSIVRAASLFCEIQRPSNQE